MKTALWSNQGALKNLITGITGLCAVGACCYQLSGMPLPFSDMAFRLKATSVDSVIPSARLPFEAKEMQPWESPFISADYQEGYNLGHKISRWIVQKINNQES